MEIACIACFLVYPGKGLDKPQPSQGILLTLEGRLYGMLQGIFNKADTECNIPIRFLMAKEGTQHNEVRDLVIGFASSPTLKSGNRLADRLRDQTTMVPGLGLLFFLFGHNESGWKLVLSRFPAEQGITAEIGRVGLEVKFIERIFMKSAMAYKAALFAGPSFDTANWSGYVVDKQLRAAGKQVADYWRRDFLASDFKTTSKAGTKRIAVAFRDASRLAPAIETKQELVGASFLLPGYAGQTISLGDVMERLNLSEESRNLLVSNVPHERLVDDTFTFDRDEYLKHAAFSSVELDNGSLMIAPSGRFNDIFHRELLNQETQIYRFSTEGRIVDERLRVRK